MNPTPVDEEQVITRVASIRANGLQLVSSILDDGSNVGKNPSSLVPPGHSAVFKFYALREGGHMLYSMGSTTGGEGDGGQLNSGLFGAVNVQPTNAEWYRSQVTAADLKLATIAQTAEPFFFRANTNDRITFYHTNLMPAVYELDDYQVRTPTDII